MTWCWSKLSAAQWEDAWNERLAGNPNAVMTYLKGGKSLRLEVFCATEAEALALKDYFGGSVRELKSQDWIAKQALEKRPPIKVRDKLIVSVSAEEGELLALKQEYPKRHILSIPAEMAFGTGDHATTSTCLRLLADEAKKRKSSSWEMLDVGCGTGILALAAFLLGAKKAEGFDFDPIAVEVSKANASRNGLSQEVPFFCGDVFEWEPPVNQKWPVMVANLFSTILARAFPRLENWLAAEGTLIVSGILATQWEETRLAAEKSGLIPSQVIKKGKWVTASLARA